MRRLFLILIILLFSTQLFSKEFCSQNREKFLKLADDLYVEYKDLDPEHTMSENKKAFWIQGDPQINKAVFVAHGYMGSPAEMLYSIEPFKKAGWSIVGFLLPGHGATYEIANSFKNTRWTSAMKTQLELVMGCFDHVQAIGFSTGGLLLHQYVLTNPRPAKLRSLHLISPYFLQRFGGSLDRILGPLFNGISVETAYFISRFRDLKVMTLDKESYNQELPVYAGLQVKDLGLMIHDLKPKEKSSIPVQLFLSEGDWTVDTDVSKEVINRSYNNVQLVWFEGKEPHHLMCPSVSKVAPKLQRLIFEF